MRSARWNLTGIVRRWTSTVSASSRANICWHTISFRRSWSRSIAAWWHMRWMACGAALRMPVRCAPCACTATAMSANVLWTDLGPHFVDFDDSRMGPAIQDIWMLLFGEARRTDAATSATCWRAIRIFTISIRGAASARSVAHAAPDPLRRVDRARWEDCGRFPWPFPGSTRSATGRTGFWNEGADSR